MMISGDVIRLKNLVDDCARVIRVIHREWGRLTPEEREYLADHIRNTAPHLEEVLIGKLTEAGEPQGK